MARKRTLQTIKKTNEKESCDGLLQTCTGDAEQTEKKDELCKKILFDFKNDLKMRKEFY